MKKYYGFKRNFEKKNSKAIEKHTHKARKSLVKVRFSFLGYNSFSYYNDKFDLKVGDQVYVEGKFEGMKGTVEEVCYSFKIKPSDYKKVISVVDTSISGDFYIAGEFVISFSKNTLSPRKIRTWFNAPSDEEFVCSVDEENCFPLDNLKKMDIRSEIIERGKDYYHQGLVKCVIMNGSHGFAIVDGSKAYEVEFDYDGEIISNLTCTCPCTFNCKHEYAVMLRLQDILRCIKKHYGTEHNGYFAAISKRTFMDIVMTKDVTGKISL